MKKLSIMAVVVFLMMCMCASVFAEAIDINAMTYEELESLKSVIDTRMEELRRQYAIENGNRVISFDSAELKLFEKQRQQLTPTVERILEDAPEQTEFVWKSSDESVATVSSDGRISAVSSGNAVITCIAADDEYIFTEIPVTVGSRVTAVGLSTEVLTLHLNDINPDAATYQIEAILTPDNALCQDVRWTSNDEDVATVDENGVIQAKAPGKAVIRATSNEEVSGDQKQKTRSCDVTVIRDVASIVLDQENVKVKKGSTATLTASVLPEDASNKKLSWESNDEGIATVSAGKITAKACGTCQLICRATDGSEVYAICDVTVYQPVTSIAFDSKTANAYMGMEPVQLVPSVLPDDATDKRVAWSSSDPAIVRINEDGYMIAAAGGTCEVTCTALDGSEKSATITVVVPSISVEKESYEVTEKSGLEIPIQYFGKSISDVAIAVGNKSVLSAKLQKGDNPKIEITPERAGTTTVTLKDNANGAATVKLDITVASSAVYDSKSYPKASYESILRNPDEHDGNQYQIYGKVLQKSEGSYSTVLRVGTTGGYYDSVFYVRYYPSAISENVIEDDYVTIYGICQGTETYKTVMGSYITIPSMLAEKIKIGKKSN